MRKRVLGIPVDPVSKAEAVDKISVWLDETKPGLKLVATAYSEFFVTAMKDVDFRMALEGADLVTPDGIGPLAAIYYDGIVVASDNILIRLFKGLLTGAAILSGKVGEPVSGYWLFKTLVCRAEERGQKIFLLGGFGDTVERLAQKLKIENEKLKIDYDAGAQNAGQMAGEANEAVIAKINKFKPDLLFVAYGPVKQEKWLIANRERLRVKVAIGVGGTFDEALGLVKEAPVAFSKIGLKWLWRLLQQPRRLPRVFTATFVFAYFVFAESFRNDK